MSDTEYTLFKCAQCLFASTGRAYFAEHMLSHEAENQPIDFVPTDKARALRFEKGKPPLSWLVGSFLKDMAMVLYVSSTAGGGKYPRSNWRKGAPVSESLNSALRHLTSFADGEDTDPESKQSHLAHVAINCMFIVHALSLNKEFDDRDSKVGGK